MDGDGFLEVDLPAHVYYSDHYRQTKPPDFETWRKQFPYFQVTGASVNTATDDAFGHWVPAPQSDLCPVNHDEQICSELEIVGAACLQPLPVDTSSLDEEIIAWYEAVMIWLCCVRMADSKSHSLNFLS